MRLDGLYLFIRSGVVTILFNIYGETIEQDNNDSLARRKYMKNELSTDRVKY